MSAPAPSSAEASVVEPLLIQCPSDLIANAYLGTSEHPYHRNRERCYLAPVGSSPNNIFAQLFVVNRTMHGQVTDELFRMLSHTANIGHWFFIKIEPKKGEVHIPNAMTMALPTSFKCPTIRITPALAEFPELYTGSGKGKGKSVSKWGPQDSDPASAEAPSPLLYIAIIQSHSLLHGIFCKIHLATTRDSLAELIFADAVNGYGVIFTGAMLSEEYDYWCKMWRIAREEKGRFEITMKTVEREEGLRKTSMKERCWVREDGGTGIEYCVWC